MMALAAKKVKFVEDNGSMSLGTAWIPNPEHSDKKQAVAAGNGLSMTGSSGNLLPRIISYIRFARDFICLSSFLLEDTSLLSELRKAADRGVRIYMLTAAEQQIDEPYWDEDAERKERREAYKKMILDLTGRCLIRTGEHLHSKFIIFDPKTNPKGFMFTCNLTQRALTENIELALELDARQVRDIFLQFYRGFWIEAKREILEKGKEGGRLKQVPSTDVAAPPEPEQLKWTVGKDTVLKSYVRDMISSAKESLTVSCWTFEGDHDICKLLKEKAEQGLGITLFTRPHNRNMAFLQDMIKHGVTVYAHRLLHAKSIVTDGKSGLIMTANISPLGMDQGFESGFPLTEEQIKVLKSIFDAWKASSTWILTKDILLEEIKQPVLVYSDGKLAEMPKPAAERVLEHGNSHCRDMEEYISGSIPEYSKTSDTEYLRIVHRWNLIPPTLPGKAKPMESKKEDSEKSSFDLFTHKGKKFLVIDREKDFEKARDEARKLKAEIVARP